LQKAMAAKEGWASATDATYATYLAFILTMAPALLLAAHGWRGVRAPIRFAAFLLPLGPLLLLPVTPFPRTFFPLWPVWLLLLGEAWGVTLALLPARRRRMLCLLLLLLGGFWCWGQRRWAEPLSELVGGARFDGAQDDWFAPYYVRDDFQLRPTAEYLERCAGQPVYVSFAADPFALQLYQPAPHYLFWYTKAEHLAPGTRIVLARDEKPEALEALKTRFHLTRPPVLEQETAFHRIYRTE